MAITQGYGGSAARQSKLEKDDEYIPVHKTEEFREVVRRIKERDDGRPAASYVPPQVEEKKPAFVPMPTTVSGVYEDAGQRLRRAKEKERDFTRNQVKQELYTYLNNHPGASITNVNEYVEAETAMRMETKKNKSTIHDSSTSRHASRVEGMETKKEIEAIRQQVIEDTPAPSPGSNVSREEYQQRIEKETKRLVDLIKKPRYVFLSDGTPFHLTKEDERAELELALIGEPTLKRRWMMAKYDLASAAESITKFIDEGSQSAKEVLTDTNSKGNVLGGIAQLGLNSAILGIEYLRFGDFRLQWDKQDAERLRREAEAAKFTDPAQSQELLKRAAEVDKAIKLKEDHNTRLKIAGAAVDRSWATLFTEIKESNEFANEHYDPDMRDPETGRILTPIEQKVIYERQQEEIAKESAASIRVKAEQAYAEGNFEEAIQLTKDAIEQDKLASDHDAYGAYTWMREPESYENFKEDAALLELQKGAPLTKEEVRRLKEYHANAWTEITGELAFDPTNLIPAVILEKAIGIPLKTVGKVAKTVAKEVPIIGKTAHVLGSPVRWLLRQSVQAGGNKVKRQVYNTFERVSNAYLTSEEVTKAIDDISNAVLDAKRAPNEQEARAIFETARQNSPGLQQIAFGDFKQLMDAGEHLDPTAWGKMYSDALSNAEVSLTESATMTGKRVEEVVSEISKNRWALEDVASKFSDAFIDPHRIFKGSRLTDDTLAGWITKKARAMSGDEINEMMKLTKNDQWLVEKSAKMGTNMKKVIQGSTHVAEAALTFGAVVRDLWATTVLTTFRFPILNLADTSMRSVVWGGNLRDDLVTLFTSTQRTLADAMGISPIEFNQALSRQGLKATEGVSHRLVYEGWKPKAGILSYIGHEYKRLLMEHGDKAIAKSKTMTKMLETLPDGILKKNLAAVYDGMNYRVNLLTGFRALAGGVSDFNTAIEFTFRLRMFHKEYFRLLEKLEPKFMERGMDALSPSTKLIARQIWRAADGNASRITAMTDNLLGGAKNTPAIWSVLLPPEFEQTLKGMDLADQNLLVSSVQSELDEFIETATRTGKELKGDDFKKFFEDFNLKMQDEVQHRLSLAHEHIGVDGSIRTDGQANKVLTEDDIQGSMPVPKEESPRNKRVEEAIGKLNRKKRRAALDIHKDFEDAISDYAEVERVSGDGMRLVTRGGKPVIEVGDNLIKKGAKAYYNAINENVIAILKRQDTDLILHSGFRSVDEYDGVMREFFDDPTAVLNNNERQFLALVNQMENHPNLRRIIEQTSPDTVRKYDSALDVYRDIGEYSDVYGFNKRPDQIMMSEAEKIRPMPGSHVAAANGVRLNNRRLIDLSKTVAPEITDSVREFVGQLQVFRQELKQFYSFTFPGPLMKSTTEANRHAGWDLFYRLSEAEFKKEAEISSKLIELIQKDPEAAKKYMEEVNDNFAEFFLKENGVELEWDVDHQMIMNIKVRGLDGKHRNFTQRRDIANLQIRFFSPKTKKAIEGTLPIRLAKDPKLAIHLQLRNALRDTFQADTAHAEAWAKVIDNHAEKWAQETGQPIEAYYERLGFQKVDSSSAKGLGTLEQTRIVKRGAIKRNEDGTFMFFGLSHSNFESMVRETGELFFDDLISMAEHSAQASDDLKALKTFLEKKTGKPIRANRLEQAHSDVLSDTFSTYIATGHGPDIKIKNGFDRLKKWINTSFDAVRDSKVAGEIPDDTYRVLDRMFTEAQIFDVPSSNRRAIRLMAKEADLVVESEDELLQIINNSLDTTKTSYTNLGDVPKDIAARVLGTPEQPLESAVSKEIQEGWETWRTQRTLVGFPPEALTDPDTFKAYLRQRMGEEWGELENHYNRLLWEVEQFEDAMMNYHAGDDLVTTVFPRVHEAQMSDGMRTFVRNQVKIASDYEISRRALKEWGDYLAGLADEGSHPAQLLTKEEQAALKGWAYGDGSKAKAEMVSTILHGNDDIDGAIPLVNKRMLDYQNTNRMDQFMKNWFPFWMFPSRSFPFWAETLATHPQIIANYEKVQRLSRSQRYQAGAVTSQGKPLPSLDGYIQIPGTDMWFNPLAAFSFRYLLDVQKSKDDILYAAQSADDDIDPKSFVASELMQSGQIYGFSLGPWAAWLIKDRFSIPDEIIPRYPLIPEIQLIPRWMVQEQVQRLNQMNLFGWNWQGIADQIYPEVPWHDYMVERRILEDALQQIQSGNLSEADKLKVMNKAQNAIKYKNDALWQQTYKDLTSEASNRSIGSFFTGMYAKNWGDGEADLLALRNEINLLKSSLNNEFQSEVFGLPVTAEAGWDNYLRVLDTPEGWVHRLYTDIGWVKNGEGELVRDPKERARWLATKIKQDENQQMYYDKMSSLQKEFNKRLRALPVGVDWEQTKIVYDWYANERASLDYLRTFEKIYGTNKPLELIQKDMSQDWFRQINEMRPTWDSEGGETYDDYQERVMEWEQNLPNIAPLFLRAYLRRHDLNKTLNALHPDQQFNVGEFFGGLAAMTNKEGLDQWHKENDDVFDALNNAWKSLYWEEYWNGVIGKSGYEVDLAEQEFYQQHPNPPSADELYAWITEHYGAGRFTPDEIKKWVDGTDELDITQRQLATKDDPADWKKRNEIWDMLSWKGPGNRNSDAFDIAFANAGGDPDWLTTWYQEGGQAYKTKPERLDQLHGAIQEAVTTLGLQPPTRAELVRYIQAQKENEMFQQAVKAELGNQFFDYEDENGLTQQGVYSYYNALPDYEAKKKFASDFPEENDAIQAYYDMKDMFSEEHLTWADYYGFETEPTVNLPESESGATMTPPSLSAPAPRPEKDKGRDSTGAPKVEPRPTQALQSSSPTFSIYDRTSTYVSPGLYNLIGQKMAGEIASLFSNGKRISSPGLSFLRSVASRYPEYRDDIDRILAKNGA